MGLASPLDVPIEPRCEIRASKTSTGPDTQSKRIRGSDDWCEGGSRLHSVNRSNDQRMCDSPANERVHGDHLHVAIPRARQASCRLGRGGVDGPSSRGSQSRSCMLDVSRAHGVHGPRKKHRFVRSSCVRENPDEDGQSLVTITGGGWLFQFFLPHSMSEVHSRPPPAGSCFGKPYLNSSIPSIPMVTADVD
ncbi:hypothetical protein BJX96DRAFT_142762 [Aspergillus floccosus]